jgi:hypothetical protein
MSYNNTVLQHRNQAPTAVAETDMVEFVLLTASSLLITGLAYALARQPGRRRQSEAHRHTAEVLGMTGRLLAETPDPDIVGQRIVDSVRGLMSTQACTLYRLQPDSGVLLTRAFKTKVWELSVIYSHA